MKYILLPLALVISASSFAQSQAISFTQVPVADAPFVGVGFGRSAFADIDNDGDLDAIFTGHDGAGEFRTELYKNNGSGIFTLVTGTPFEGLEYSYAAFADVDGDGDQDLLLTGRNDSNVSVARMYANNGTGVFTLVSGTPFPGTREGSHAFADVDNDGDPDLLLTGRSIGYDAQLFLNNGSGVFALAASQPFTGVVQSDIAFADIDNDGDLDVAINGASNTSDNYITQLYTNNGSGVFALVSGTPFTGVTQGSVDLFDIDNDNDPDLLMTGLNNVSQPITRLYRNNFGTFSLVSGTPFTNMYSSCADFADIDADGDKDVILCGLINGGARVANLYRNNGGTFALVNGMPFYGITFGTAAFADTDGDNDPDLLIAGVEDVGGPTSRLYENATCHHVTATDTRVACNSYTWINGVTYTSSNSTATHTLPSASGCDSIITLHLTVKHATAGTDTHVACNLYTWINGVTYTSNNSTATHTLTNAAGCDSIVTLHLTIKHATTGTDTRVACDSYTWINGVTYTSNNSTATHTLTNAAGCDSIVTLHLTIKHATTDTASHVACDSYTWINGVTYTASTNTPTFTLTNAAGCDSVVTLHLTIHHPSAGTDVQTACDSYTWIDGMTYTANTTTPTYTLTNAGGCDSIVTLQLTINHSTTGTDTHTACDAYTWIDGMTYTSDNSTATHTLANVTGCDSIVTLHLVVLHSTTGTDVQSACDSYTWMDGVTYTSSNSTASYTLANAAGCDSIVTLHLSILHSYVTDTQTACDSYTWIDGITYTSDNTTATYTLTNVAGCDSTITLHLTLFATPVASVTQTNAITLQAAATGAAYEWINCTTGAAISGAVSPQFTASANGSYAVVVSNGSCNDTSSCFVIDEVGLAEAAAPVFSIAPNPTNGKWQIGFDENIAFSLVATDLHGRIVYAEAALHGGSTIDFTTIPDGVYILQLQSAEGVFVRRIVKE